MDIVAICPWLGASEGHVYCSQAGLRNMSIARGRDSGTCPLLAVGTPEHVHCSRSGMDIVAICPVLAVIGGHVQRPWPGWAGSLRVSEGHVLSLPAGQWNMSIGRSRQWTYLPYVRCSRPPRDMSTAPRRYFGTCPLLVASGGHAQKPWSDSGPAKDMSSLPQQDSGLCPSVAASNGHSCHMSIAQRHGRACPAGGPGTCWSG
jgi:hypothetical protein